MRSSEAVKQCAARVRIRRNKERWSSLSSEASASQSIRPRVVPELWHTIKLGTLYAGEHQDQWCSPVIKQHP